MCVVVNVLQVSTGGFLLEKTGVFVYYYYVDNNWSSWSGEEEVCVWLSICMPALCWIFLSTVWGFRHCVRCSIPNYCVKYFILCCAASIINLVFSVFFNIYIYICRTFLGYSCGFLFSLHVAFTWYFHLGPWHVLCLAGVVHMWISCCFFFSCTRAHVFIKSGIVFLQSVLLFFFLHKSTCVH